MSKHVFKEPRKGFVAHNAASRLFAESDGLNDWTYVAMEDMWPSIVHLLDAMDKWKGSEEANETVSRPFTAMSHQIEKRNKS